MSSSISPTALADALAVVSRTAHKLVADAEGRARSEVASAVAEANEARSQREKALKDQQTAEREAQAWKDEVTTLKAALGQAELTIAHQTDTITQQIESIAQLRREVTQWKDQSQNWQDHFTRVEQERFALSTRIDELLAERVQWTRTAATSALNPFTSTPQSRFIPGQSSSSQSADNSRRNAYPSPSRTSTNSNKSSQQQPAAESDSATLQPKEGSTKPRKSLGTGKQPGLTPKSKLNRSSASTPLKPNALKGESAQPSTSQIQRSTDGKPTIRETTVIRRVHAVVEVKREESDDEEEEQQPARQQWSQSAAPPPTETSRRRNRMVVEDDDYENDFNEQRPRRRTATRPVNYAESDDGESSEGDELTLGNESCLSGHRTKGDPPGSPAKKKRRMVNNQR
ncbi:hypothetical protein CC1G_04953 [Coprinopsis cinerea okayama7|uniref:Uncharacterized protein n=1 Tax=Coprinopsis cinerea (strain Okayama-7 / 130 / ATCC MYA-4618 / FGSC 9003) TaxID=240176 RepID=A8NS95_COPC7|nr:hypothetical protein CC1G_04953 [Coprinopsis cinerea okayama7\|eukprot:XP_001835960.2 hypothetical protein CC1G_04953 [Coprinopsis cinerea okayama7\